MNDVTGAEPVGAHVLIGPAAASRFAFFGDDPALHQFIEKKSSRSRKHLVSLMFLEQLQQTVAQQGILLMKARLLHLGRQKRTKNLY